MRPHARLMASRKRQHRPDPTRFPQGFEDRVIGQARGAGILRQTLESETGQRLGSAVAAGASCQCASSCPNPGGGR
jgi:hypothetical protein